MYRWTSYGVTKARYDDDGRRLLKVEIHRMKDGGAEQGRVWPRRSLVQTLRQGYTVVAMPPGVDPDLLGDHRLHLVLHEETYFVRVDGRDVPADDLGRLPVL